MTEELRDMVERFLELWAKPTPGRVRAYGEALEGFSPALLKGVFQRLHRDWTHDRAPMPSRVRELASKAMGVGSELVGFDRCRDVVASRLRARDNHNPSEAELHLEVINFAGCDLFDPRVVQESRRALQWSEPEGPMPKTEIGIAAMDRMARALKYESHSDPRLLARQIEPTGTGPDPTQEMFTLGSSLGDPRPRREDFQRGGVHSKRPREIDDDEPIL